MKALLRKYKTQDQFTSSGGYRSFAKRKLADSQSTDVEQPTETVKSEAATFGIQQYDVNTPSIEKAESTLDSVTATTSAEGKGHFVQVFTPGEAAPVFVRMSSDTTAGSITMAESSIGNMNQPIGIHDAVGCAIPLGSYTAPFQQIFTHYIPSQSQQSCSQCNGPTWPFPPGQSVHRVEALRCQRSWVAVDEMHHYLRELQGKGCAIIKTPISCDCSTPDFDLGVWIEDCLVEANDKDSPVITAFIKNHHWVPLFVQEIQKRPHVFTTQEGIEHISNTSIAKEEMVQYHVMMLPHSFQTDCGFQTVGWLGHLLEDVSIKDALICGDRQWIPAMQASSAVFWRRSFEHHLFVSGEARSLILPQTLQIGGAIGHDSPDKQVEQLLLQHGVPQSEVAKRAQQFVSCLGRGAIVQAMRSKHDWAELKALANAQQPRLQLVLPSVLAQVIKNRAESGKPFGDKAKKQKGPAFVKQPLVMQPQDVTIPDGLFKQGEDGLISQIPLNAIRPDASGIVVVNAVQAQPYLKLAQPLSANGLALLVIDPNDPICNGVGQVIRFPGRFEKTGEPFIGTGRLIQLGSTEVCRFYPQSQIKVDEVVNHVYRVVAYRDEFEGEWKDFIQRPIKHVLDFLGFKNGGEEEGVIDIWDRQWLSHRMERQKPMQSDLFQVNLRLAGEGDKLTLSGSKGYYVEPRSFDGRAPSDSYRVMWLPKTDLATATTSLQAAKAWACLVRAGKRFGLRTLTQDAQQVHDQYKPHTPFLEAGSISHFLVGPLPFGATKATLAVSSPSGDGRQGPSSRGVVAVMAVESCRRFMQVRHRSVKLIAWITEMS